MKPCKHGAPPCDRCVRNRARVRAWEERNPSKARAKHRRFNASPRGQARHRRHNSILGPRRRGCLALDRAVTLDEVFHRDGGLCWLCGRDDVAPPGDQVAPIGQRASIDHVLPLKHGGAHTWANVRLAHVACNSRRGAPLEAPPAVEVYR